MVETILKIGDCLEVLAAYPDEFFDLIVTSPPYANSRRKTYGGIEPGAYVDWFLPRSLEFKRVLKSDGTFVLNIKECITKGERDTYVLDLIKALKAQGWLWTEEFIWHKKNAMPGFWPNRLRDSWERCLQFNKDRKFKMFQARVARSIGDWHKQRLAKLSNTDLTRHNSENGSGFGRNVSAWLNKKNVLPGNVLHLACEVSNKKHSAVFPYELPEFFIKLFADEGSWVLDPFCGSGTTGEAAKNLQANFLGIDIKAEHIKLAQERIKI